MTSVLLFKKVCDDDSDKISKDCEERHFKNAGNSGPFNQIKYVRSLLVGSGECDYKWS